MIGRGLGFCRSLNRTSIVSARRYAVANVGESLVKPLRVLNAVPGKQFGIAQGAAERLEDIYRGSKEVLRIKVESGGCHGFQYNMKLIPDSQIQRSIKELESSAKAKDEKAESGEDEEFDDDFEQNKDVIFVLPGSGAKVVLDESTLKILHNTTLTYTTELIGSTFKIAGGNMKSSCGCGSSFDIEANQ